MQSSQIVPGNSAHESPSHANLIQQPTFGGSFCTTDLVGYDNDDRASQLPGPDKHL